MPWDNGQFDYTEGSLRCYLIWFLALREHAINHLDSFTACAYYDLLRAMQNLQLTKKQKQALEMRLNGYTNQEIADECRVYESSVRRRLYGVEKKMKKFLE